MMEKIATRLIMVTGCNRGIGLGMMKALGKIPNYKFLMTVRSMEKGKIAIENIKKTVPDIEKRTIVKELDISKSSSIDKFIDCIKNEGIKIDCMFNNAGMAHHTQITTPEIIKDTFATNFYGTVEVAEKMVSFLPDSSKIIFMGSALGRMKIMKAPEIKKELSKPNLTREDIFRVAKNYYDDVAAGKYKKGTFPFERTTYPSYCMSKLLVNLYAGVLGKRPDILKRAIQVYACCPGWVRTEMGGAQATLSVEEGIVCPLYLISLPYKLDEKLQGCFFSKCKPIQI